MRLSVCLYTVVPTTPGNLSAGHLPSTYQVEGKNHGRVTDSIITEIAPGLMRIENENAVVFTFSETREDFP